MYCKCTKGNSYKVIGLCNPKKYDQDTESAWIQITVPEIIPIPKCYPDIEDIERVYVNVLIESTKVIETATSTEPNEEGTKLTGRKLMVDGNICQTVVYTADNCEQSLHSINLKFPFCTSIVLAPNTDVENDKFCVEACIENVFAKALNSRTIFKSVTLFLLAKKATPLCPEDSIISGTITNNTGGPVIPVDVIVELYDELANKIAAKEFTVIKGTPVNYEFVALCDGEYTVKFITTTTGVTMTPNEVGPIAVPPGAINVNSTATNP